MTTTVPKAGMHTVERYTVAAGLSLLGLAVGAAASLMALPMLPVLAVSAAVGMTITLAPGARLRYRFGSTGLMIGSRYIPFERIAGARIVRTRGLVVFYGLTLPGCWSGAAWLPGIGRVDVAASTGLGQGVLLTLCDGGRLLFTPADPVALVVQLQRRPSLRCALRGMRE